MKLLGIIPARGGSKGIAEKNITLLAGKPLIEYSIEAAIHSNCFDGLVVSTEDQKISKIAGNFPNVDIIDRPIELASDTATSDSVIAHVIEEYRSRNTIFTHLMLLQPTSPLRSVKDIESSWELYKKIVPELLLSVSKPRMELHKAFLQKSDGFLSGLLFPEAPFMRRQDLPNVYIPNGAIYICSLESFDKNKCLPREFIYPYEMDIDRSLDIDTIDDLKIAESYLQQRGQNVK